MCFVYLKYEFKYTYWNSQRLICYMQSPIRTSTQIVKPEWCDYNGHMNVAYYTLAFENAAFEAQEVIDFGERYVKEDQKSIFTTKATYSFLQEMNQDEPLYIDYWIMDYAPKLIHVLMEMYHAEKGFMAAHTEQMMVNIDMRERRSAVITDDKQAILEQYKSAAQAHEFPKGIGDAIGIKR